MRRLNQSPDSAAVRTSSFSNSQLKSLGMELLGLIPMEGIEGSGLDSEEILEVVLRAAVDRTSVNGSVDLRQPLTDRKELREIPGSACPDNDAIDDNSAVLRGSKRL